MPEMSKSEEAAFASMQEETAAPAEPEQAEQEGEAPAPPEADEGEAPDGEPDAPAPREQTNKFVPHAAFHEERRIRQQLEAENRRLSEDRARFDERLRVIQEMNQPAPPAEPDENVDPIGTIGHLRERLARLEQGGQQWSEQQRQQAQTAQLASAAAQDATAFRAQTPDYADAFQYWSQSRANELMAYGVPAHEVPARLGQEQLQIAAGAYQRGVSPAETLYNVAKQRGYSAKAAAQNGNGAAEHIERVATGQSRSPTLSGTGGGAASVKMTAEQLLSMSNDDFDAWTNKNPAATARLMGKDPARKRG